MAVDNILEFFEREKAISIPPHIKNLLLFTGFDNKYSLSKLEGEEIAEIERVAREVIPNIIKKEDSDKFLGYFKDYPQGFCIFPGHKKILQELAQFYKHFSYRKRSAVEALNDNPSAEANPKPPKPRDVESEKQNIQTGLTNWIVNFCSRNLPYEEAAHVNKELPKLKVDIMQEDTNQCFVTCCICLRELKIFRNQSGFWIMSNIHKHFKTHLNAYSNKKFSKNISISSSISNMDTSQEADSVVVVENDIKQENDLFEVNYNSVE